MDNCGGTKNAQQTIGIDDDSWLLDISLFPYSLYICPQFGPLICPVLHHPMTRIWSIMFFIMPFMPQLCPNYSQNNYRILSTVVSKFPKLFQHNSLRPTHDHTVDTFLVSKCLWHKIHYFVLHLLNYTPILYTF